MTNQYHKKIIWLGLGHGLNDFMAGYLLGNLLHQSFSTLQVSLCFVVYNALAFGGQYFAALWLRSETHFTKAYRITWVLNLFAIFCFAAAPQAALVAAGCASAIYHVAGGSYAAQRKTAFPIGLFAAPGIIGLSTAGYLSFIGVDAWLLLKIFLLLFLAVGFFISLEKEKEALQQKVLTHSSLDRHDVIMILLLFVITARSAVWTIFQLFHEHNYTWLIAIAASAFIGKIAGGWISDKFGWVYYNFLSLGLSMPLVSFFKHDIVLFCIGIALLQSGIPANTALLVQCFPRQKEKAIAFAFGGAVIVAGVFATLVYKSNVNVTVLLCCLSGAAAAFLLLHKPLVFAWAMAKRKIRQLKSYRIILR